MGKSNWESNVKQFYPAKGMLKCMCKNVLSVDSGEDQRDQVGHNLLNNLVKHSNNLDTCDTESFGQT